MDGSRDVNVIYYLEHQLKNLIIQIKLINYKIN